MTERERIDGHKVAYLPDFSDRCQHRIRIGVRIVNKGRHIISRKKRDQRTARMPS